MKHSILSAASCLLSFTLFAGSIQAQDTAATPTVGLKPIITLSCYKKADPLKLYEEYAYMADGWCQEKCGGMDKPVMAITGGSTCYCGDTIPALDLQVSNSSCNQPCNGFGTKTCGGLGYWQVYLTGLTTNVKTAPNSTTPDSSSSSSPSVVTKGAETVIVTASSDSDANKGPNKVGIAIGVVVGLVVISGLIGGLIFYLRQKKRREVEEEYKRNAAISSFVTAKNEATTATDQRLDPTVFSHRRESVGSIADEMDFSRRILQVRNPDRSSQHSTMA